MIVSHSRSNKEACVGQRRGGPAKIHDQTFANQKLKYKVTSHSVYGLSSFRMYSYVAPWLNITEYYQ